MTEEKMVGWHQRLMDMSLSKPQELVMDRESGVLRFMGSQRVGHDRVTELNRLKMTVLKDCPIL